MKRVLPVLLALLICALAACACAEVTVGTDITAEDITDFYYTVDASRYPPEYLRYRFYVEDGARKFYHESRQGGGWPQTEEDIVFSGTVELTDEDWNAFFDCLRGGTVSARSDEVLDGDAGPWTYLYWTGDNGDIQEFSFASLGGQAAFEELCSRLARDHVLTRFYYLRGGYMAPRSWEIALRGGSWTISENEGDPMPLDADLAEELQRIIAECDIDAWDGFRGSNSRVLDGESFILSLRYADGSTVYASGENKFPDTYYEASDRIDALIEQAQMRSLAGTYLYEGEGFGGDFTITLNADGTYTFYEGSLSSYMGGGTWSVYYNTIDLEETNGFDLSFTFAVDGDELIYIEMNSDAFPYVDLPDEASFIRREAAGDHPDYGDKNNWAYFGVGADKAADLFLICPTVDVNDEYNMSMDDDYTMASFLGALNMERGIYEDCARMYAPYYRQAAMKVYSLSADEREKYLSFAYGDVSAAFRYYLEHENRGRPIILAGFSQGADICCRLLAEYFGDEELYSRLVAVYAIGWPCTEDLVSRYPQIRPAQGAADTGTVISFDCEAPEVTDTFINPAGQKAYGINPLNWRTDDTPADRSENPGACFTDYGGEIVLEVEGLCGGYLDTERGVVKVTDIDIADYPAVVPGLPEGAWHVYDYQFFFRSLQENVRLRLEIWLNNDAGR